MKITEPEKMELVKRKPNKRCAMCQKVKGHEHFYFQKYSNTTWGFSAYCKECKLAAARTIQNGPEALRRKAAVAAERLRQMEMLRNRKEKKCPTCAVLQPITNFGTRKSEPDGHACVCKVCCREKSRAFRRKKKPLSPEQLLRRQERTRKYLHTPKGRQKLREAVARFHNRRKVAWQIHTEPTRVKITQFVNGLIDAGEKVPAGLNSLTKLKQVHSLLGR